MPFRIPNRNAADTGRDEGFQIRVFLPETTPKDDKNKMQAESEAHPAPQLPPERPDEEFDLFNLSEQDCMKLIEHASVAPYGDMEKGQTVVDPQFRRALEIRRENWEQLLIHKYVSFFE